MSLFHQKILSPYLFYLPVHWCFLRTYWVVHHDLYSEIQSIFTSIKCWTHLAGQSLNQSITHVQTPTFDIMYLYVRTVIISINHSLTQLVSQSINHILTPKFDIIHLYDRTVIISINQSINHLIGWSIKLWCSHLTWYHTLVWQDSHSIKQSFTHSIG